MTQRNASAAEELAATAEEMAAQAEGLQNLVSFFRVGASLQQQTANVVQVPTPIRIARPRFVTARAGSGRVSLADFHSF